MAFNEDSRVKIPAILTLMKLGYGYISIKDDLQWNKKTNIFEGVFINSIKKINNEVSTQDLDRLLKELEVILDYDDLGKTFYEKLVSANGIKLIDFENFSNNTFNVVTELTCQNGDDEFRPDITLLINGMPLCFIEVKKPNNKDGILAERERINVRFQNEKFRRFINISQLLMFSNNMEYDDEDVQPLQGVFYSSTSKSKAFFNSFKEELPEELRFIVKGISDEDENVVLKDNNLLAIKSSPEFKLNKDLSTPTNRSILSLFSKDRLSLLLKYGLAYVETNDGIQKHVMRYPQFFASKAIQKRIDSGISKGIIWHTQGSGKTALSYYSVKWLTDYFKKKNIIPKFYFIVDRLDLKNQAQTEFVNRGLNVNTVDTRSDFIKDIQSQSAINNSLGQSEITVLNIHKFTEDSQAINSKDYNIKIQRVYFIDEAHRSYSMDGSFLVNLINSDPNAIFISLTGTPLISGKFKSKDIFGDYIHKYYYNASIADGYTLKLIREDIETQYKAKLRDALAEIDLKEGDIDSKELYSHKKFLSPMLEYIVKDLSRARIQHSDDSLGGMVVCHSSNQAKELQSLFTSHYKGKHEHIKSSAVILNDIGSKDDRKTEVEAFKRGEIDVLFVYNMLLTGFDSPRLKKLYLNREVKKHNLLQTLTRVNRPYKDMRYGYVVDFADIQKEFDKANKAYWDELQGEMGDDISSYSNLFKSEEEISEEISDIKNILWDYSIENKELFSQEISKIKDKKILLELKRALSNSKSLYNMIKLSGYEDLLDRLDFNQLKVLLREVENHIDLINKKEALENSTNTSSLLNLAMEDIVFSFKKVDEKELKLADELKDILRKTRHAMLSNIDKKDPKWTNLKDELFRLFQNRNLEDVSQEEIVSNIKHINQINDQIIELNRQNALLSAKYSYDEKYVRVHKRLLEESQFSKQQATICEALCQIKEATDSKLENNDNLLANENYFSDSTQPLVIKSFTEKGFKLVATIAKKINNLIVNEYIKSYKGINE